MNNLEKYLGKFKVLKPADQEVKEVVIEVVFKRTGIELKPKQLRLSNFDLYLDLKPVERSEIYLKKEAILAELRELLDKKAPKKIL